MQSSNIPPKIVKPFANAASGSYVNTIPVNSQTGGRASLADGFPPVTFQPLDNGGVPPFGADMNGILKEITAIQQWQEAGGFFPYDAAFSTANGGYPKGAILLKATNLGLWQSTVENNTTNPDTGGAGWIDFSAIGYTLSVGSETGYQKFPNGLIIQYGYAHPINNNADTLFTLPITFPTASLSLVMSTLYLPGSGVQNVVAGEFYPQNNRAQIICSTSGGGGQGAFYIALGY